MHKDALTRRLALAEQRAAQLESWLEDKSRELFASHEEALNANRNLRNLYAALPGALVALHADMHVTEINSAALALLGMESADILGQSVEAIWPEGVERLMSYCVAEGDVMAVTHRREEEWFSLTGERIPVLVSAAVLPPETGMGHMGFLLVALDLRERRMLEVQLRHAQKMESVGQLAAGIAHEINTPLQFLSDNVHFMQDAFDSLLEILPAVEKLKKAGMEKGLCDEVAEVIAAEAQADIPYLRENVPQSVLRSLEGIDRVTSIVRAVKAFSRNHQEMAPFDLNAGIETTLEVARNEYKYVAEVKTSFGDLPLITCNGGEIGQVVLNLVVNAAHAIADKHADDGERGVIVLKTDLDGGQAVIRVSDEGNGIPEAIRHRIFDPFFTTKEVGRGTGQGLTLAHSIVCERHGGSIDFESVEGQGTTFTIRLPVQGIPQKAPLAPEARS